MKSRWTKKQIERAHQIVNDIAEGIDNKESCKELRQSLAIYADLLMETRQEQTDKWCKELMVASALVGKYLKQRRERRRRND